MNRNFSLEGCLCIVLSDKLNRRGVTRALGASALVLSAAIAIPFAMLRAGDDKPVEETTSAAADIKPKHEDTQKLFKKWQDSARANGEIPGGALRSLASAGSAEVQAGWVAGCQVIPVGQTLMSTARYEHPGVEPLPTVCARGVRRPTVQGRHSDCRIESGDRWSQATHRRG